jgi:hypothetical protein
MTSIHPAITKDIADIIGKYSAMPFIWLCTVDSDRHRHFLLRGTPLVSFVVRTQVNDGAEAYKRIYELFKSRELTFRDMSEDYYVLQNNTTDVYEYFSPADTPNRAEYNGRKILLHNCTYEEFIGMMTNSVLWRGTTVCGIFIELMTCIN